MKKLIKRGFAALLALTLALGMSVSAFAVEGTADTKPAVAKKDYRLTNPNTTSPEEDLPVYCEKVGVTDATDPARQYADPGPDMPNLTITPVSYTAAGGAGSADSKKSLDVTPDKDFPSVGIYTYTVTETEGDIAGVGYSKQELDADGHGLPRRPRPQDRKWPTPSKTVRPRAPTSSTPTPPVLCRG